MRVRERGDMMHTWGAYGIACGHAYSSVGKIPRDVLACVPMYAGICTVDRERDRVCMISRRSSILRAYSAC